MFTFTVIYRRMGATRNLRIIVQALTLEHARSMAPLDAVWTAPYRGLV